MRLGYKNRRPNQKCDCTAAVNQLDFPIRKSIVIRQIRVIAMKRIGMLIGFLAVLAFLLPLAAQDAKKGDKKETEKKVDPDKKDPDKKDPEKKEEKKKEKLVYGAKFVTKIVNMKGETNREYTIEVQEV